MKKITFEQLKRLVKESSGEDYDPTQRKINAQWEAFDSESKDIFCEKLMQTLALAVARGRIKESSVKYLIGEAAGWSHMESLCKTFMAGFEHQLKLAQSDIDDEDSESPVKEGIEEGRSGIPSVFLDINPSREPNGWTTGHAYLGDTEYEVQIKWFDEPSQFGIKGGRISKLWVAKTDGYDRDEVMCYDRGWDTKPKTPEDKEVLKAILKEFN